MKKNILFVFIGAMLIFAACQPIEKRHDMGPALTTAQLNYSITVENANYVHCINNSPGTITYWSSSNGAQSNQSDAKLYIPLKGTYKVKLTVLSGTEMDTVSQNVVITGNDLAYFSDPLWQNISNGATGKTWVWAADIPGGAVWGNGSYLGDFGPGWWKNTVSQLASQGSDGNDELTFQLTTQSCNVSVNMPMVGAKPGSGSGFFDMKISSADQVKTGDGKGIWSYGKLTLTNVTIPLGFEPNSPGKPSHYVFDILKCTQNELVLAFPSPGVTGSGGEAWFYMLKRKGYTY